MKSKKILPLLSLTTVLCQIIGVTPVNAAIVQGAKYYYTLDGTTPSENNGILWDGVSQIKLDAPDTDASSSVTVKVIGIKDGYAASDVVTTTINYAAKEGYTGGDQESEIKTPVIVFNKDNPVHGDNNVIGIISNTVSGVDYYYTVDGTEPTTDSIPINSSFIQFAAPDSTEETNLLISIAGFKDGQKVTSANAIVTYQAKVENAHYVVFKDRTYNDIETVTYKDGENLLSLAPQAPEVDGYTFVGWSSDAATVNRDMIVRAMYEKNEATAEPTYYPTEIVENNGIGNTSYVYIEGGKPNGMVTIYADEVADTPSWTAQLDSNGEATIECELNDDQTYVYASYFDAENSQVMLSSIEDESEIFLSSARAGRKRIQCPTKAQTETYSLQILSSRLTMKNRETLQVRGISDNEIVNVYDKDNKLLGRATQNEEGSLLTVDLNKSVEDQDIYVARVQPKKIESQQTQLDKKTIESQLTAKEQTYVQALQIIKANLSGLQVTNNSTFEDVKDILYSLVTNENVEITLTDTDKKEATDTDDGYMKAKITVTDKSNKENVDELNLDKKIEKLENGGNNGGSGDNGDDNGSETISNIVDMITEIKDIISSNSDLSIEELTALIKEHINSGDVTVNKTGNIYNITINVNGKDFDFSLSGDREVPENMQDIYDAIKEAVDNLEVSNETVETDFIDSINTNIALTTDAAVSIDIHNYSKENSTTSGKGIITGVVKGTLENDDLEEEEKTVYVDIFKLIEKLQSDNGSGDNGQGGNGTGSGDNGQGGNGTGSGDNGQGGNGTGSGDNGQGGNGTGSGDNGQGGNGTGSGDNNQGGNGTGSGDNNQGGNGTGSENGSSTEKSEFDKIVDKIKDKLDNCSVKNTTDKSDIKDKAESVLTSQEKKTITIKVENFDKDKSTRHEKGSLTCDVIVSDKENHTATIEVDKKIAKVSSGSSSGGGSSSSSSGSSSSNSSDKGSGQNTSGNATDSINKDAADIITNILGDSSSSTTIKDGSNAITNIYKDGKYVGSVVRGGSGHSFSVGHSTNGLSNIYVFIPEINKFVKVIDGITINDGSLVLNNANVSYFVTSETLPAENVVELGWYSSENGNKYYVESTGVHAGWLQNAGSYYYFDLNSKHMITGWIQDTGTGLWYHLAADGKMNTGWFKDNDGRWYHLNTSGMMQTGWFKDTDGRWYYLNPTSDGFKGSMKTGWIKEGQQWYFLHSDGHMAANEVINGYTLGSNGAWVR